MGSYQRTDPRKHIEERIKETIQDIGASITVTSLTSTVAFGLGCMSDIPAVYWLCLYAFPSVILVYFYQLTFFVACISLDEQRITDNRRDCFTCFTVPAGDSDEPDSRQESIEESNVDRFMEMYAEFLLRPRVKIVVVAAFALLSAFCAFSASKIRQKFDVTELLPDDSHVLGFVRAQEKYVETSEVAMTVYFRDVNQSLPEVRQEMYDFVNELVNGLDAIEEGPDYFWSKDLDTYVNVTGMQDKPFAEQLDNFFQIDPVKELHGPNVKRDGEGNIIYSKVSIELGNLDLSNARQQMETLKKQREITNKQPINKGRTRAAFFTFLSEYKLWSFYESCVNELITSAVIGVATVTLVAMFLIPHWTATFIVFPMMCILYIDMLGMMQWAGVSIDPVSCKWTKPMSDPSFITTNSSPSALCFRYHSCHVHRSSRRLSYACFTALLRVTRNP
jgi:Niemann-Pick C1 protein